MVFGGDSGFGLRLREGRGHLGLLPWYLDTRQIQDALGTVEAWVAQLCAHCGWGFWALSPHLAPSRNDKRQDSGIWQGSRAEATENDSACSALSPSVHWN